MRTLGSSQVRTEQKATKVLGVVFFVFIICWAPFFTHNLLAGLEPDLVAKLPVSVAAAFQWLGYVSSTLNPIIYTTFNRTFRRTFRRLLMCQSPSRRRSHRLWRRTPGGTKVLTGEIVGRQQGGMGPNINHNNNHHHSHDHHHLLKFKKNIKKTSSSLHQSNDAVNHSSGCGPLPSLVSLKTTKTAPSSEDRQIHSPVGHHCVFSSSPSTTFNCETCSLPKCELSSGL